MTSTNRFNGMRARALVLASVALSGLGLTAMVKAEASVYEGWGYTPGTSASISPGTGLGWGAGSGYFAQFPTSNIRVASGSLNHPLLSSVSGNSVQANAQSGDLRVARPLAMSTVSSDTYWMSFVARRDSSSASYAVGFFDSFNSAAVQFGVGINPATGRSSYMGRREQQEGPFVRGTNTFVSLPLTAEGTTDLFLVRINPGNAVLGSTTFDFWINPADPSNLGSSLGQVVFLNGAISWPSVRHIASGATLDEFRLDRELRNVVRIPGPASLAVMTLGGLLATRRRR